MAVAPERLLRLMRRDLSLFEVPVALPKFNVIAAWHPRVITIHVTAGCVKP